MFHCVKHVLNGADVFSDELSNRLQRLRFAQAGAGDRRPLAQVGGRFERVSSKPLDKRLCVDA